jgi:hypothetical protein
MALRWLRREEEKAAAEQAAATAAAKAERVKEARKVEEAEAAQASSGAPPPQLAHAILWLATVTTSLQEATQAYHAAPQGSSTRELKRRKMATAEAQWANAEKNVAAWRGRRA